MGEKAGIKRTKEITGLSEFMLRKRAKEGTIPCLRSGNKIIFDIQLLEEFLKNEAMGNVKSNEAENNSYGQLRKIY